MNCLVKAFGKQFYCENADVLEEAAKAAIFLRQGNGVMSMPWEAYLTFWKTESTFMSWLRGGIIWRWIVNKHLLSLNSLKTSYSNPLILTLKGRNLQLWSRVCEQETLFQLIKYKWIIKLVTTRLQSMVICNHLLNNCFSER